MAASPDKPTTTVPSQILSCACFNARQAARAITSFYDAVMEPIGIKVTQFAILATIHADARATMQSLASELGVDPSTMTRTLRPLAEDGLVEFLPGEGGDRRIKRVVLTSRGRHTLGLGKARWEAAQSGLSEKLGPEVFDRLLADLSAVTRALRQQDSGKTDEEVS